MGDFQGFTEATGGGRGSNSAKIEATSFMDELIWSDVFKDKGAQVLTAYDYIWTLQFLLAKGGRFLKLLGAWPPSLKMITSLIRKFIDRLKCNQQRRAKVISIRLKE